MFLEETVKEIGVLFHSENRKLKKNTSPVREQDLT